MIQKMILATYKLVPISDKESYAYIRLKTPGENIIKMFRKAFNKSIRAQITEMIKNIVIKNPNFSEFDLKQALDNTKSQTDIDKILEGTINTGREKIKIQQGTVENKTQSSNLNRDNQLATLIEQRKIVPTQSDKKQGKTGTSESSIEIRHVHPTYVGYVCPIHSPEGQETGLIKQLAITAIVSKEANTFFLINQILSCDESIHRIEHIQIEN